jgi:peptidoglycan/LPS O-acetylase OafA/YrhL
VLEYIGSRSYALYLVHVPAEWIEYHWRMHRPRYAELVAAEPDHAWRQALVQLGLALLLAEGLHRLVEKPFMALGRRLVDGARRRETEGHPEIA